MIATVNGEPRELREGSTVADLLRDLALEGSGIAVAVNERVVRNAVLKEHTLRDGDVVEVIRAVAGG
ncbi:MAG: sulfur carrier protein ThiS [Candidatus Eremiobacteraeota bacterium]|nr:sulfur carrier protein ThiS [Candidatus Eremiobacteraeota bacterium]